MRIAAKPTEQEIIEGPQAVSFQIANGNVRQSCILQTELPTKAPADAEPASFAQSDVTKE